MTDVALTCEGLTRHFRRRFQRFTAVDGLSLTVPRGATFGLLGPNGAGKTTTISMLLGLVKPSAGTAHVLGGPIGQQGRRRLIGFVPEKFQLPGFLSAEEFMRVQGSFAGLSGDALKLATTVNLERVGLESRRKDRVSGFSKGMQQRLMLAQAMMAEPELLILDEPTSALDPGGRREVRDLIRAAHARGATVLLNSHLLSEVEAVCDHVAIMRGGKLLRQGAIAALTNKALQVEARIGELGADAEAALRAVVDQLTIQPGAAGEPVTASFQVPDEAALARVSAAVVGAGARLYTLVPHVESLEDLFLRVTEEA